MMNAWWQVLLAKHLESRDGVVSIADINADARFTVRKNGEVYRLSTYYYDMRKDGNFSSAIIESIRSGKRVVAYRIANLAQFAQKIPQQNASVVELTARDVTENDATPSTDAALLNLAIANS